MEAAVAAGVERLVYTSFLGAAPDCTFTFGRDHFHTENLIREAGIGFTFLRDSIYLDFVPFLAGADGVIRGPAGDGRVAAVARDDIADVALAALLSDEHAGAAYELSGGEAFTMTEAAEIITRETGREVRFVNETLEEARESRRPSGAPDWEIEGWVTTYAAIAAGELDVVTDDVERIAGHPPMTLVELLQRHPESWGTRSSTLRRRARAFAGADGSAPDATVAWAATRARSPTVTGPVSPGTPISPTAAKSPITQSAPSVRPACETTNARGPTSARGPTRSRPPTASTRQPSPR